MPGRTVAWISGPPGSGKTSLAASYLEARRYRGLWYQVDPDDADVATFFHYLGHAARKLDGTRAPDLPAYSPQFGADLASFSRRFFRQLFSRAAAPVALVLDNLHRVPPESALQVVLEAALTQIPKGCCVIVTSRGEPPTSLARLRVTGEMICVGADSLHLDAAELVEVAKIRGHTLSADAAAQLYRRTQGWMAAIVLMLEHTKLSGRIAELPGDATPKAIFDYLAGEIFDRFEARTQQFLLRVACLPRITAAVAESLSGEPNAARLLLNLALNDYFVKEVPWEKGRIFQFHPLLRDFLRDRAARDLPEALAPAQMQRAAGLLRAAGHTEDAVSLLVECSSWREVAAIAGEAAGSMLAQGRSETLGRWLDLLPAELLEADPRLLHALGACRSQASPRSARRHFEQAYESFRARDDQRGMLACCCGLIDAVILEFDDLAALDPWIAVLKASPGNAAPTLARAMLLRDPANVPPGTEISLARAIAATFKGDFAASEAMIAQFAAEAGGVPGRATAALGLAAALNRLLAGDHEKALETARAALAAAETEGAHAFDGWLRAVAAAASLGAGDLDSARADLQILAAGAATQRRGDRAVTSYLRSWLASLEGDAALALREARGATALAVETGIPALECLARVAWAQLLADSADRPGCEAQLRAAAALAQRLDGSLLRFAVHLAAADASRQANDEPAALQSLAAAFRLGRERGFDHVPAWRPRAAAELCVLALRNGIEPDYARRLVKERRLVPQVPPLGVRDWPWAIRISMLGGVQIMRGGAPVEFSGKGPGRPMELLKLLLALGGQGVRTDLLADTLWPHIDADYAHNSLTATLHRLRRMLGEDDALTLRDGRLGLNPSLVWVDTWALEQAITDLDDALRSAHGLAGKAALKALAEGAFALYRGPFLPDESEKPGYIACREQLRARLLRCLGRLAKGWEDASRGEAAADCYLRLIEADPLFEAPYRNLMLCYQRMGDTGEARAVYERLRTVLATRMKAAPSPETQAVFAALMPAAPR